MFIDTESTNTDFVMENEKPIDWALALKLANNKPELAKEMLTFFVADLPQFQHSINQTYANANYEELQQQVHKLHGASCYCGAPRIKSMASELETALKRHNKKIVGQLVNALDDEIKKVITSFEASDFN